MKRSPIYTITYYALCIIATIAVTVLSVSCSESESDTYNAYNNWQERNEVWFRQIADSARTAIRQAQRTYGDKWEQHCNWRMYKALAKSPTYNSGLVTDSICVRIIGMGTGSESPVQTDSVRCNYRGWLMPVIDANGNVEERVFDQTYYGQYNTETAFPQKFGVSEVVSGLSTAFQYMVDGDDWHVYIPYQLGYGVHSHNTIPAFSALHFRVQLMAFYPKGTVVPPWR